MEMTHNHYGKLRKSHKSTYKKKGEFVVIP